MFTLFCGFCGDCSYCFLGVCLLLCLIVCCLYGFACWFVLTLLVVGVCWFSFVVATLSLFDLFVSGFAIFFCSFGLFSC